MKQNLLSVSYHIAQYTNIIADLRSEIQRLKRKIEERGGRSPDRAQLGRGDIRHIQGACVGLREPEPVSRCPSRLPQGAVQSDSAGFKAGLRLFLAE